MQNFYFFKKEKRLVLRQRQLFLIIVLSNVERKSSSDIENRGIESEEKPK